MEEKFVKTVVKCLYRNDGEVFGWNEIGAKEHAGVTFPVLHVLYTDGKTSSLRMVTADQIKRPIEWLRKFAQAADKHNPPRSPKEPAPLFPDSMYEIYGIDDPAKQAPMGYEDIRALAFSLNIQVMKKFMKERYGFEDRKSRKKTEWVDLACELEATLCDPPVADPEE